MTELRADHAARCEPPASPSVLTLADAIALVAAEPPPAAPTRAAARDDWAMHALANATGRDDILIDRRASGRPRLGAPYAELGVSLSASAGYVAVGFSPTRSVGVDIEKVDRSLDAVRFAADHYAPTEASALRAASPTTALDLCYRLWVAKEAVLKISGRGVFDGVATPCLAQVLAELAVDGRQVPVATCATQSLAVATRELRMPDGRSLYVALAVSV